MKIVTYGKKLLQRVVKTSRSASMGLAQNEFEADERQLELEYKYGIRQEEYIQHREYYEGLEIGIDFDSNEVRLQRNTELSNKILGDLADSIITAPNKWTFKTSFKGLKG